MNIGGQAKSLQFGPMVANYHTTEAIVVVDVDRFERLERIAACVAPTGLRSQSFTHTQLFLLRLRLLCLALPLALKPETAPFRAPSARS